MTVAAYAEVPNLLSLVGTLCQMCTATLAVGIGIVTFRYTKQQSALTLINHNNALANTVNNAIVAFPDARAALCGLHAPIVGSPDDAVLFMYLNYVHNTYRMRQIGAIKAQVWQDTLLSCVRTIQSLRREQIVQLLARGYEAGFQAAVLDQIDALPSAESRTPTVVRPVWNELKAA